MRGIWIFSVLFLIFICKAFGQGKLPKAPAPIVDAEPSATSILLQWKRVASPHRINRWRLQYLERGAKKQQVMIGADENEYLLEGLKPETAYRVRMLAQAAKGPGKPSAWIDVTTLSNTPPEPDVQRPVPTIPEPPENVVADAAAHTARITWDPPRDNGVTALGYIISYGPRDNPRDQILSVDVTPRLKEIDGLDSNVQYRLTITAFNTQGQSDAATVDFYTLAEEVVKGPPPPIENLEFSSPSPTSVRVTWSLPETTALNEIENIIFGSGDEGTPFKKLNAVNLAKTTTSHTLDGLQPVTRYTVMVVTENRYGSSKRIQLVVETMSATQPTTPAPPPKKGVPPVSSGGHPPSPENLDFRILPDGSAELSWTVPDISQVENVGVGFGSYGIPAQFLTVTELERTATTYVADQVNPGSRYTAMVVTRNQFGQSDPVVISVEIPNDQSPDESSESSYRQESSEEDEVIYLEVPADVHAEVVTARSVRLSFIDPTLADPNQVAVGDRYYTVRYKTDDAISFQYIHLSRTNDVIQNLEPERNYQFEVKVVRGVNGHSLYSLPINIFTRDPDYHSKASDVTVVQMKVIDSDNVSAVVNWLPPESIPLEDITGYIFEYVAGWPTANSVWERKNVTSSVPVAKLSDLRSTTSYYMRVAHLIGDVMGEFSDPPDVVTTPTFQQDFHTARQNLKKRQPWEQCTELEPTSEEIIARINWMRSGGPQTRTAFLGVPLPYCDEYYPRHKCHGLVCFCIPGRRPVTDPSDPSCGIPPETSRQAGIQGDQPPTAPCHNEYKAAVQEIEEARSIGKSLNDAHLPYCTEDGYYQPKQCLGSLCYCSTRDGMHTGKEAPIWRHRLSNARHLFVRNGHKSRMLNASRG